MTVISTRTDVDALTLTLVAEFGAPVERVWQVWADPRLLEAWYCPPDFPATFTTYEFVVGGSAEYHATGPDGTRYPGWWTITAIDAPTRLEYTDGFADAPRLVDVLRRPALRVAGRHARRIRDRRGVAHWLRRSGKRMTSRIDGWFVSIIASRSMPIPKPAAGGMPCSSART